MKKITMLMFMTSLLFNSLNAQTINFDANNQCPDPQTDPPTPCWIGFMNVSNLPNPFGDGVYQFGSGWGIGDLNSTFDLPANTVTLTPNRIGDTNAYWQTDGEMEGEKIMEANLFIQDDGLATSTGFSFTGNVVSNTLVDMPTTITYNGMGSDQGNQALDVAYSSVVFIKIFNSDFSAVLYEDNAPLIEGADFSVSYDGSIAEDPSNHVQYGFQVVGPNINSRGEFDEYYAQLGSIVIQPATLSLEDYDNSTFTVYPNPTNNIWNVKSNHTLNKIQLFDILGKEVLSFTPNMTVSTIDTSKINKGVYFAILTTQFGSETIKLVKN